MTELQQRLANAERGGGSGIDVGDARGVVFRSVRRRRAARATGLVAGVAVAAIGLAVATVAIVQDHRPLPPAVQPTVTQASDLTTLVQGQLDVVGSARRMWDQVDDRWALAMVGERINPDGDRAVRPFALLLTAPDGRTATVAKVDAPGESQLLAWDPVNRTALLSTTPAQFSPVPQGAELAVIDLDGGENVWTEQCSDFDRDGGVSTLVAGAAVDGGYVVRNGCGVDFFTDNGSGRWAPTDAQANALMDAIYPRTGITSVTETDTGVQIGTGSVHYDTDTCHLLVLPRSNDVGAGCSEPQRFSMAVGLTQARLGMLPGAAGSPFVVSLCGTGAVLGTLSDGSFGVGLIQGEYALPVAPDGVRVSECRDGRYTWYVAGGDLFSSVSADAVTKLIDLDTGESGEIAGIGVVAVAPAPSSDSLG